MSFPQNEAAPLLDAASAALRLADIEHTAKLFDHGAQVGFLITNNGRRYAARFPADGSVVEVVAWAKDRLSQ